MSLFCWTERKIFWRMCHWLPFSLMGPVPNGTPHVHLRSYGLTMGAACPLSPRDRRVSHSSLAFKRVLASAPLAAVMRPRSTLLPSPHWGKLRCITCITNRTGEDRKGLGCHLGQSHGNQWCPTSFVFGRTKKFIQVWNYLRKYYIISFIKNGLINCTHCYTL